MRGQTLCGVTTRVYFSAPSLSWFTWQNHPRCFTVRLWAQIQTLGQRRDRGGTEEHKQSQNCLI